MKKYTIKINDIKTARVFSFLDEKIGNDKYRTIEKIANKIPKIKGRHGGFAKKEYLKYNLDWLVFGHDFKKIKQKKVNEKRLVNTIKEILDLCSDIVNKKIYIFIFPNSDYRSIKKLDGISGFNPYKNAISIALYKTKRWKKALKETIAHETAHASSCIVYASENTTLGDALVLEGIAEHFKEAKLGKGRAPWTKVITRNQIINIFKELKPKLNKKDDYFTHSEVFFGTGKYPHWAGYSIGYYLIQKYLKGQKNINWKRIIKMPPKEILKEST